MPRNDDLSLILAKAKLNGMLPDVKNEELDAIQQYANVLFSDDAALSSIYAPTGTGPIGNRWVTLGDSLTAGGNAGVKGDKWPSYASLISQAKFFLLNNAGITGNTTAQMLARIQTDVLAYKPQGCTVLAGTNDIAQSVPLATYQANIKAIIGKLRAANIVPVLCTMPPNSPNKLTTIQWNNWIKKYAISQGIALIDFFPLLADPVTGGWQTGYSSDGIHPLSPQIASMGRLVYNTLKPFLPAWTPPLSQTNIDTDNWLPNPMFTSPTAGVPASWSAIRSGTGTKTNTTVADTAIQGVWCQTDATGWSADAGIGYYSGAIPASWQSGDIMALSCYLQVPSIGSTSSYKFTPTFLGFTPQLVSDLTQPLPEVCLYYAEFALGTTPTQCEVDAVITGGTGSIKVAQPTLYNLTRMGIA